MYCTNTFHYSYTHLTNLYILLDVMNAAAEKLFKLLDSDGDGFITREDIAQLCDKLELDEGPDAFYKHLDLLDDPYR